MNIKISGGHVIDPANNINSVQDIYISGKHIVDTSELGLPSYTVNAHGCYVVPGLIDFHSHIFHGGSYWGMHPDLLLSTGVTTVVDAGTAGCANFEAFYKSVIIHSLIRIKAQINLFPGGIVGYNALEKYAFKNMHEKKYSELIDKYPDSIIGFKIRMGKEVVGQLGLSPLRQAVSFADRFSLPVVVHGSNPPCTASELVENLRKNDVFCHFYHGKGMTILDENGKVQPAVKEAQKRGVLYDASNGASNFSIDVAKSAFTDKLFPDIISTDASPELFNYSYYSKNLPFIMSKYLTLGLPLKNIVKAVTQTPAKAIGMEGKLGTLKSGAYADIAIFKLINNKIEYRDNLGRSMQGDNILIPQMTILNGEIVFSQNNFNC